MPRAQLPEDSSAVDMDILFPLDSVIETEVCPSSIPQIIHFVLFVVFSLVILIILRPYIPREPSSVPPREEDSENDQAEVGEWLRIGNKYITLKDCRILLKELENLEIYTFLLENSSQPPEPLRPLKHPSHKPRGRTPPRRWNPGWVSWTDSTQADSETDAIICPMCKAPECSCLHTWWVPSSPRVIRGVGRCSDPNLDLSWRQEAARAWCHCTSSQFPFEHPNLPTHLPKASF
ncbi:uncharacterized protein C5orf60-like isoform X3 [Pan troglodytes]|uniref:uncharacterized protein C5orf60-like isoform X3 n=1 Tax=Pan troglodytes TaxID=9598 RepID=UPI00301401FC